MQHSIVLGTPVRCADGKLGTIGGLIINPNRSHVDYVILRGDQPGGHEYFVPSGQIQRASERGLSLPCSWSDLEDLPHPDRPAQQGTLLANLSDLLAAREQTIVRDAAGSQLGTFHGAIVDANLEIQALLLADAPDRALPISQLAAGSQGTDDLVVHLTPQELEHGVDPALQ
jgi:hypothetical protein